MKRNNHKGITLVEVIVYMAIAGIAMTTMIGSLVSVSRIYGALRSEKNINTSAVSAFTRLSYEIRIAKDAVVGGGNQTLSLTYPDLTQKCFSLSAGALTVGDGGCPVGAPVPLTSNRARITSLQFTKIGSLKNQAIQVKMNVESSYQSTVIKKDVQMTTVLRGAY